MRCGVMHSCASVYLWIVRFGECYQHTKHIKKNIIIIESLIYDALACCNTVLNACQSFFYDFIKNTHNHATGAWSIGHIHTKQRPILPQFINVSIWLCVQLIKVMIMKLFNCVHHACNNGMGRIEHVVGVLLIAFLVFPLQNWIWRQKLAKLKYKPTRAV